MLKKFLRWLLFGVACLITLLALVIAEENWRGKRAWEQYKRTLEARGEPFGLVTLAPPPVPDDQNLAMTPLLKPLFPPGTDYAMQLQQRLALPVRADRKEMPNCGDWATARSLDPKEWQECFGGTNILEVLHGLDPELDEISSASRRRYARFPIRWHEDGFLAKLPHLSVLRQLVRLYTLRACAELTEGQTEQAARDVETIFRLGNSIKDEPPLISQLVRIVIGQTGLQVVWEGLSRHQWSDSQLAAFQDAFQRIDFLSSGLLALQSERNMFNDTLERGLANRRALWPFFTLVGTSPGPPKGFDRAFSLMPRAWLYRNLIAANRHFEDQLFPIINLAAHRVDPQKANASDTRLRAMRRTPYSILVVTLAPALSRVCMQFARDQSAIDEAIIACALERYRLVQRRFPDNLDALVPQFVPRLPHDVISGQSLLYRRTGDGGFMLYSVGWNETDDGGKVALTENGALDPKSGDWVWFSQPQPSASERK